jgi:hypothetical protein
MGDNGMIPIFTGRAPWYRLYSLLEDFSVEHRISEI